MPVTRIQVALAQIDPTVGDLDGNVDRIVAAIDAARDGGAALVVTPELSLLGYPPRDLLSRRGVVERCERALEAIADAARGVTVLVGHPRRLRPGESASRPLRNSLSAVRDGRIVATYDKRLLPSYDVFDEDRHFAPGASPCVIDVDGVRVGLLLCEDLWAATDVEVVRHYGVDCVAETVAAGAGLLAVASASPFVIGKRAQHLERLCGLAHRHATPMVSVNQVGGKDDMLFDGASVAVGRDGAIVAALPAWSAATAIADPLSPLDADAPRPALSPWPSTVEEDLFAALLRGVRDYFTVCGLKRAVIGLSGGIDSAVTATIAAAALGPSSVCGLLMPSRHSSAHSIDDALDLAARLRLGDVRTIPIEPAHATVRAILDAAGERGTGRGAGGREDVERGEAERGERWSLDGLPDENLQSRLRGMIVMTVANAIGGAALATGNKSELATGYCTLYGDMIGAVAPLGDLVKTRVWDLARWINANHERCGFDVPPIPESSIDKVPSAELRPDQRDEDTLLPYPILDAIVEALVDHDLDIDATVALTGRPIAEVERVRRMIDTNEHKRRQAPLILKVTPRAFGPGRRMPLAMRGG